MLHAKEYYCKPPWVALQESSKWAVIFGPKNQCVNRAYVQDFIHEIDQKKNQITLTLIQDHNIEFETDEEI